MLRWFLSELLRDLTRGMSCYLWLMCCLFLLRMGWRWFGSEKWCGVCLFYIALQESCCQALMTRVSLPSTISISITIDILSNNNHGAQIRQRWQSSQGAGEGHWCKQAERRYV